jgi:hypothetical protein
VVGPVSRREAARSLDVGAPADATGSYQALATVETGLLRRSRREITKSVKMTAFWK